MEPTEEADFLLDKIQPPRLEDAGLEDCALPPEAIREAFFKAALSSRSIVSDEDCLTDPWQPITKVPSNNKVVGIDEGAVDDDEKEDVYDVVRTGLRGLKIDEKKLKGVNDGNGDEKQEDNGKEKTSLAEGELV